MHGRVGGMAAGERLILSGVGYMNTGLGDRTRCFSLVARCRSVVGESGASGRANGNTCGMFISISMDVTATIFITFGRVASLEGVVSRALNLARAFLNVKPDSNASRVDGDASHCAVSLSTSSSWSTTVGHVIVWDKTSRTPDELPKEDNGGLDAELDEDVNSGKDDDPGFGDGT